MDHKRCLRQIESDGTYLSHFSECEKVTHCLGFIELNRTAGSGIWMYVGYWRWTVIAVYCRSGNFHIKKLFTWKLFAVLNFRGFFRSEQLVVTIGTENSRMMNIPRKFLEIRCSGIASEAILGQKYSHTSYLARGVLRPIFTCPLMHLLSQLTSNFPERRYQGWQNSRFTGRPH